MCLTYTL